MISVNGILGPGFGQEIWDFDIFGFNRLWYAVGCGGLIKVHSVVNRCRMNELSNEEE